MGCLARLGCLILLVVLGVCAWFTRGLWIPARLRPPPPIVNTWQPVTDAGAARTQDALEKLSQARGPVYQTLSAGDVASLAFSEASRRVGGSVEDLGKHRDWSWRPGTTLGVLPARLALARAGVEAGLPRQVPGGLAAGLPGR